MQKDNLYSVELEIKGRRGSFFALALTEEEAKTNTAEMVWKVTGLYPIILSVKEEVKGA